MHNYLRCPRIQYEKTMSWQARTAKEISLPRAIGTSAARKFWTMTPRRRSDIKYYRTKNIGKSISSGMVTDVCYLGIIGVPVIAVVAWWVITATALRALWNSAPAQILTHRCAWCVRGAPVRGAEITKPTPQYTCGTPNKSVVLSDDSVLRQKMNQRQAGTHNTKSNITPVWKTAEMS